MKLLIFGDVFGKLGREGVKRILPVWREKFSPDVVIANVENIAHGKGIGRKQIEELRGVGVDIFTGGNHSLEGKNFAEILNDETLPILRPANIVGAPGRGVLLWDMKLKKAVTHPRERSESLSSPSLRVREGVGGELHNPRSETESARQVSLLVINLIGQVFMKQEYENPFLAIDKILAEYDNTTPYKILDWHADATSEKSVMGWYLDGKVSAVFGTHTHVPTADAKILPKGTAYISDIGMVGPYHSIIGVEIEPAFERFRNQAKNVMQPVELGPIEVNALYLELNESGVDIQHLREIFDADKM